MAGSKKSVSTDLYKLCIRPCFSWSVLRESSPFWVPVQTFLSFQKRLTARFQAFSRHQETCRFHVTSKAILWKFPRFTCWGQCLDIVYFIETSSTSLSLSIVKTFPWRMSPSMVVWLDFKMHRVHERVLCARVLWLQLPCVVPRSIFVILFYQDSNCC